MANEKTQQCFLLLQILSLQGYIQYMEYYNIIARIRMLYGNTNVRYDACKVYSKTPVSAVSVTAVSFNKKIKKKIPEIQ